MTYEQQYLQLLKKIMDEEGLDADEAVELRDDL